jgi:hypothetical protein
LVANAETQLFTSVFCRSKLGSTNIWLASRTGQAALAPAAAKD